MSLARWKDLCLDATDAASLGAFWGTVLGLDLSLQDGGDGVLRGGRPEQTVWVNRVPEAKTVKNRVHLDLARPTVEPLLAAGARVVQEVEAGRFRWVVLADPEGGELCVFDDSEPSALVVDSADPVADARWWAEVLGGRPVPAPEGVLRWVGDVPGLPFDVAKFVEVPEPKTVKNRIHWDVVCDDVPALVARGARVLREPDDVIRWHVLADPAGNEFCAFAP